MRESLLLQYPDTFPAATPKGSAKKGRQADRVQRNTRVLTKTQDELPARHRHPPFSASLRLLKQLGVILDLPIGALEISVPFRVTWRLFGAIPPDGVLP